MVAIGERTPLARRRWVSPAELPPSTCWSLERPGESFLFQRVLGPLGLKPAKVSFIMLTEAMIELARAGMGIGILPRWSAQRAIASGAVVPLSITRKGLRRRWAAGTLAAQPDPPAHADFIDLLAERGLPARAGGRDSA